MKCSSVPGSGAERDGRGRGTRPQRPHAPHCPPALFSRAEAWCPAKSYLNRPFGDGDGGGVARVRRPRGYGAGGRGKVDLEAHSNSELLCLSLLIVL